MDHSFFGLDGDLWGWTDPISFDNIHDGAYQRL